MVLMMLFILVIVFPKFKKVQKQTDNLNAVTRENLSGVRVCAPTMRKDIRKRNSKRRTTI